ncbi:MAG TPA: CBS domain-containing protein [Pilimelia sp.]|nr:CBS domain-containing protein [Pilimelia sp.]
MTTQLVRDVMTEPVVAARPETGYKEIIEVMARFGVSALPVIDHDSKVLGVVSEADLLHKVEFTPAELHTRLFQRRRAARKKAAGDTARELMTSPATTIGTDAPFRVAARLMEKEHVKRLPVVDEAGHVVGIVARRDLLRVYTRPDSRIRRDVVNHVLQHTLVLEPSEIEVSVAKGIVTLSGTTDRRSTAQIAARLAYTVDGVVDVVDKLTWEYDDTADIRRGYLIPRESDVYAAGNRPGG